jgi:hypothetical protein
MTFSVENSNEMTELLVISMEECSECAIELSKIIRFGNSEENSNRLKKEICDLLCMIDLLKKYNVISINNLEQEQLIQAKLNKLKVYSNLKMIHKGD